MKYKGEKARIAIFIFGIVMVLEAIWCFLNPSDVFELMLLDIPYPIAGAICLAGGIYFMYDTLIKRWLKK